MNPEAALRMTARRALIPQENKRNFLEVSGDIVERSIRSSSRTR
jgi:hypothetical protein